MDRGREEGFKKDRWVSERRGLLELEAASIPTDQLKEAIEAGWRRMIEIKAVAPWSRARSVLLERLVVLSIELRKRELKILREDREQESPGAVISYRKKRSDWGYMQACVYATCEASGDEVGPVWGSGERSIKRALATLTKECSCGATFHREKENDGPEGAGVLEAFRSALRGGREGDSGPRTEQAGRGPADPPQGDRPGGEA